MFGTEYVPSRDPYLDLEEIFNFFYDDEEVNCAEALVRGKDMCELLGLVYDLASNSK